MNYTLIVIFSFSIFIAVIISIVRFRFISRSFYPFVYCLWIGLINEGISYFITLSGHTNAVNNNIYILIESILIVWQFKRWGLFRRRRYLFGLIIFLFIGVWLIENFIVSHITLIGSYFRVTYSFIIVLLSIHLINELIVKERGNLLKNAIFLFCVTFVIYYTYKVFVEIFWLYGLNSSKNFRIRVYDILAYINLLSNLIYALAILWIPKRQKFTLPF